jgi:hypothetical protein
MCQGRPEKRIFMCGFLGGDVLTQPRRGQGFLADCRKPIEEHEFSERVCGKLCLSVVQCKVSLNWANVVIPQNPDLKTIVELSCHIFTLAAR